MINYEYHRENLYITHKNTKKKKKKIKNPNKKKKSQKNQIFPIKVQIFEPIYYTNNIYLFYVI